MLEDFPQFSEHDDDRFAPSYEIVDRRIVRPSTALPPCPIVPRYLAGICDNAIAIILSYVLAKSVSDELPLLQGLFFVGAYLGYFFFSELLFSTTLGKRCAGLFVVDTYGGTRPTWKQTAFRTGLRIVEVNPLLLGALPAALIIACTPNRQRLGDQAAGTMVVEWSRLKKFRS
jgi:uncharacterized RDD family membrane protein YckC